ERGPLHGRAGEPAVVIWLGQDLPALVLLAGDERLTGLALGVERVEILLQPLLAALSRIDRAATHGSIDLSATGNRSNHWRPSRRADASPESCGPAVGLRFNPKNLGPDQCAPVIAWAILDSDE